MVCFIFQASFLPAWELSDFHPSKLQREGRDRIIDGSKSGSGPRLIMAVIVPGLNRTLYLQSKLWIAIQVKCKSGTRYLLGCKIKNRLKPNTTIADLNGRRHNYFYKSAPNTGTTIHKNFLGGVTSTRHPLPALQSLTCAPLHVLMNLFVQCVYL